MGAIDSVGLFGEVAYEKLISNHDKPFRDNNPATKYPRRQPPPKPNHNYTVSPKKTGPLSLTLHNFTNNHNIHWLFLAQRDLIQFSIHSVKKVLNWLRTRCVVLWHLVATWQSVSQKTDPTIFWHNSIKSFFNLSQPAWTTTPKKREHNVIVCSGKTEAEVTNNRRAHVICEIKFHR